MILYLICFPKFQIINYYNHHLSNKRNKLEETYTDNARNQIKRESSFSMPLLFFMKVCLTSLAGLTYTLTSSETMMPAVVFWISSTEPPPPPSHHSGDQKAKTTLRSSQSGLGAIQGRGTLGGSSLGLTVMYFLCGCQPVAFPSSSFSAALALTPLSTNTTPPQKKCVPLVCSAATPLSLWANSSLFLSLSHPFHLFLGRTIPAHRLSNQGCTVLL